MNRFAFLALASVSTATVVWLDSHYLLSQATPRQADVIVVLGHPAASDGSPSPAIREEVALAAQLYKEGLAGTMVFSGGAVHNRHVEAEVMARLGQQLGVPASAMILDTRARDTLENAQNVRRLMAQHGWRQALVITTPYHARRASMILSRHGIRHQVIYPEDSQELSSSPLRLRALAYELLGMAWLAVAGPLRLEPFWLRRRNDLP